MTEPGILKRIHPSARGRILTATLSESGIRHVPPLPKRGVGCGRFPTEPWLGCFSNGRRLPLARWPKKKEPLLRVGKVLSGSLDELSDEEKKKGPESRCIVRNGLLCEEKTVCANLSLVSKPLVSI